METWTMQDELKDFIMKVEFDLDTLRKAADRDERDANYLHEKYDALQKTVWRFTKRLTDYEKAFCLKGTK